ncbi:hypothetical protein BFJ68_g3674 [Fusarium oxysporum]|uniref:Uncharacterized protein n=2 Tax=Fusarium oxysporum TaxID=5507 RepID=A0A420RQV7_FUSOX|nr:hypothetical protein BFJ65_g17550 [Fusarium oxysporum f. sp. cepae]RKK41189.1 hypothetical protein BFJ67_g10675 [Fusarium oxysporum f. sp. cepae]RKK47263.1 hypothetical protein BFJ66_g8197 [Fusarium oxysporum f. sp. cepae]RKL19400.1 hypothetical protein BFJ68_g3674 [Fusarium oxysporum]
MSDQSLPFRNKSVIWDLRREYKQRVSNFAEDIAQVYELRAKVDRANRDFKDGLGKDVDRLLLLHSEIIKGSDAVKTGDSLLLTEGDIIALYHQLGTKVVSEHWYECVLENIWENEKVKAQKLKRKRRWSERSTTSYTIRRGAHA